MTSSVISICGLAIAFSRGSAKNGFRVPKASECRRTETRASAGSAPQVFWIAAMTSARFSSSAAFTLKNSARRPAARISATIRSALGCVPLRSRWTPKMFQPAFASASEHASPNPEEAPRTRAQRECGCAVKAAGILAPPRVDSESVHADSGRQNGGRTDPLRSPPAAGGRDPVRARGLGPGRARRDALRRDSPRDARGSGFRRAASRRPALLREASPALLVERGFLPDLRADPLGGPPAHAPGGARHHAAARPGGGPAPARGPRGRDPAAREPDRLSHGAHEPDRRTVDVLLHGHAARRACCDPPEGGGRRMARARRIDRRGRRGRVPHEGPRRARAAGRHPLSLVRGHAPPARALCPRGLARDAGLPRPRRPVVLPGRAAPPRLPAVLLHPRALPAFRHRRGEAAGADLLLRAGVRARVPAGPPVLLRGPAATGPGFAARTTGRSSFSSGS